MAKIRIDFDGLRQNQNMIGQKISELQRLNSTLENQIGSIKDGWEGQASEAYASTMQQYHAKAVEMEGVLQEFQKYIAQAISKFEQQDKEGAARIRSC